MRKTGIAASIILMLAMLFVSCEGAIQQQEAEGAVIDEFTVRVSDGTDAVIPMD